MNRFTAYIRTRLAEERMEWVRFLYNVKSRLSK